MIKAKTIWNNNKISFYFKNSLVAEMGFYSGSLADESLLLLLLPLLQAHLYFCLH